MSVKGKTLKLGIAAVGIAVLILAATYFAAPALLPSINQTTTKSQTTGNSQSTTGSTQTAQGQSTYLVMLTDPPTVPSGTLWLNATYSGISLNVTEPDGTSKLVSTSASGTVDLLDLVNASQTVASVNIPVGALVSGLQLTVSSAEIDINHTVYNVPAVANQLSVSVSAPQRAAAGLSGAIVNLSPTVVPVTVQDQNGSSSSYFVFVPSVAAIARANVSQSQANIGSRAQLTNSDVSELDRAQAAASGNVTIVSASLSVDKNVTSISITLKNKGSSDASLFGLILQGQLNATLSLPTHQCPPAAPGECKSGAISMARFGSIPFRINGTSDSLMPILGDQGSSSSAAASAVIKPGQTITLTYTGVVSLIPGGTGQSSGQLSTFVLTPLSGQSYTIRLMGEGLATISVSAT